MLYDIIIKDNLMLYKNKNMNQETLFLINEQIFIHKKDNFPMFKICYKKNDISMMPIISNDQYDFTYNNIEFKIYTITNNIFYIVENNKKSYFIVDEKSIDTFNEFMTSK